MREDSEDEPSKPATRSSIEDRDAETNLALHDAGAVLFEAGVRDGIVPVARRGIRHLAPPWLDIRGSDSPDPPERVPLRQRFTSIVRRLSDDPAEAAGRARAVSLAAYDVVTDLETASREDATEVLDEAVIGMLLDLLEDSPRGEKPG